MRQNHLEFWSLLNKSLTTIKKSYRGPFQWFKGTLPVSTSNPVDAIDRGVIDSNWISDAARRNSVIKPVGNVAGLHHETFLILRATGFSFCSPANDDKLSNRFVLSFITSLFPTSISVLSPRLVNPFSILDFFIFCCFVTWLVLARLFSEIPVLSRLPFQEEKVCEQVRTKGRKVAREEAMMPRPGSIAEHKARPNMLSFKTIIVSDKQSR